MSSRSIRDGKGHRAYRRKQAALKRRTTREKPRKTPTAAHLQPGDRVTLGLVSPAETLAGTVVRGHL